MSEMSAVNREYYGKRFSRCGVDVRAFWNSTDSQVRRFEIMSQIGDLEGKSVLDVGCGFGDFCDFLMTRSHIKLRKYIGVDITPSIVEEARKQHPGETIHCADILVFQTGDVIDYSIASGIFALPGPFWKEHFIAVCRKMFALSRIGIGINFLSIFSHNNGKDRKSYYVEPWTALKIIMEEVSHKIILRHDYRDNDFTIFAYREKKA